MGLMERLSRELEYDDDDPPVRYESPILKAKVVSHGRPGTDAFYHTIEVSYEGTGACPMVYATLQQLYARMAREWLEVPLGQP